jgi:hypothetical protein
METNQRVSDTRRISVSFGDGSVMTVDNEDMAVKWARQSADDLIATADKCRCAVALLSRRGSPHALEAFTSWRYAL